MDLVAQALDRVVQLLRCGLRCVEIPVCERRFGARDAFEEGVDAVGGSAVLGVGERAPREER